MESIISGAKKMDKTFSGNVLKSVPVDISKTVPILNVKKLFDGLREIRLSHKTEEYRLRLTKNDKLILTK